VTRETVQDRSQSCVYLGEYTGETVNCPTCRGNVREKVRKCGVFGECTVGKRVEMRPCCATCDKYESQDMRTVTWTYGVTTVPERIDGLLDQTLDSLRAAGFDQPRLFIDGASHVTAEAAAARFGLEVTTRNLQIRAYGNWILALYELFIREPVMNRYAIFQDDILVYKNLRQYLDRCPFPEKWYWNLYTVRQNQSLAGRDGRPDKGWYASNQCGRGALGLVFDRKGVVELLKHQHMVERPMDSSERKFQNLDGAVSESMKKSGYTEYVHSPSLVQHVGTVSAIGNKHRSSQYAEAPEWRGPEFDALDLLKEQQDVRTAAGATVGGADGS
jgi:hypothetical protein